MIILSSFIFFFVPQKLYHSHSTILKIALKYTIMFSFNFFTRTSFLLYFENLFFHCLGGYVIIIIIYPVAFNYIFIFSIHIFIFLLKNVIKNKNSMHKQLVNCLIWPRQKINSTSLRFININLFKITKHTYDCDYV